MIIDLINNSVTKRVNLVKLEKHLRRSGCEMLPPNKYEIMRWKGREVGVIYYTGKHSGPYVIECVAACFNNTTDNIGPKKTKRGGNARKKRDKLLDRDGECCIYCGEPFIDEDPPTIEHLIELNQGGTNNMYNLALAHKGCNNFVKNMTLVEKVNHAIHHRLQKHLNTKTE